MSRHEDIDKLLLGGAESLDITVDTYRRIERMYNGAAGFLADFWGVDSIDGIVYPQGSVPLGTVTRQIHRNDEVDVDLVVVRYLLKEQTTKVALKTDVGDGLKQYIGTGPEGDPELSEGKRCWTLGYDGMHLDALPALPNPESRTGTGLLITDKSLSQWQFSDPKGYRGWFFEQMAPQLELSRQIFAKRMEIEDIPEPMIKTTLQQATQLLKRHRDLYFTDHLDDRPASIILTTLAAMAYAGGDSLFEVLEYLTVRMPTYIDRVHGKYVLLNPVDDRENYLDRWDGHPRRAKWFFRWIEQAAQDFSAIARAIGLNGAIATMGQFLGQRPAEYAAEQLGRSSFQARLTGQMKYGGSGVVTTGAAATGRLVRPGHTFHGDIGAWPTRRP